MTIQQDVDLYQFNTFALHANAACFVGCESVEELLHLRDSAVVGTRPIVMLGGGSNILFADRVDEAIVRYLKRGMSVVDESAESVLVRFEAGERWHDCVAWAVSKGYGGMENMALIPGSIGASPIQNIGAYGREFKDVAHEVHYVDFEGAREVVLSAEDCAFAYRDSIFKSALKGKVAITAVVLRLQKHPAVHFAYKDVERELDERGIEQPGIHDVFNAVVAIRTRKLPDPIRLANAGSFFKNPVIDAGLADELKQRHETMPVFETDDTALRKIPAAWLIEQCGLKGYRRGAAGVYEHHALVLVNHGGATGSQMLALADEVIQRVEERFGIRLEKEVNIVGHA